VDVVDNLLAHIDRSAIFRERQLDNLNGTVHARAKPCPQFLCEDG
jgi:hypothetical protein